MTPTPFISYQHHSRVKICWQTVAAFCISHCALSVRAWKSAASLQQLLPCLWTSAQLWCCQVIKAQVMLEGTWVARLCKGTWTAPPTPTSPRHPHYHSPSSQQLLSGLCLCEDTTRRGQCASASFQVGSGCWITFSPQGERKHAARAWKQIQSNVQQQDGNYSRGRGRGGRKKKFWSYRNHLRIKQKSGLKFSCSSLTKSFIWSLEASVFISQCRDRRRPVLWRPRRVNHS